MKIAYVLEIFPKLSESFIVNEIVELLKNGHDVRIFSIYVLLKVLNMKMSMNTIYWKELIISVSTGYSKLIYLIY